jgi:hypothetical protein
MPLRMYYGKQDARFFGLMSQCTAALAESVRTK